MLYNAVGKNTPKIAHFLGLHHPAGGGPSNGHRQHAQKFGKDRACGSGDMLAGRQTHKHTDVLNSILRNRSCGRGYKQHLNKMI